MRYAKVYGHDIVNGPGIRISIFVQGCPIHCPGCFNSEAWDPDRGNRWTPDIQEQVFKLAESEHINGLSILGGEPLAPYNRDAVYDIIVAFKEKFPDKDIWLWTGYTMEMLTFNSATYKKIFDNIDYIVTGPFVKEQKSNTIAFRGSSNQKIWRCDSDTYKDVSNEYDNA